MPTMIEKLRKLRIYGPYILQHDEKLSEPVHLNLPARDLYFRGQDEEEVVDDALEALEACDSRQAADQAADQGNLFEGVPDGMCP